MKVVTDPDEYKVWIGVAVIAIVWLSFFATRLL